MSIVVNDLFDIGRSWSRKTGRGRKGVPCDCVKAGDLITYGGVIFKVWEDTDGMFVIVCGRLAYDCILADDKKEGKLTFGQGKLLVPYGDFITFNYLETNESVIMNKSNIRIINSFVKLPKRVVEDKSLFTPVVPKDWSNVRMVNLRNLGGTTNDTIRVGFETHYVPLYIQLLREIGLFNHGDCYVEVIEVVPWVPYQMYNVAKRVPGHIKVIFKYKANTKMTPVDFLFSFTSQVVALQPVLVEHNIGRVVEKRNTAFVDYYVSSTEELGGYASEEILDMTASDYLKNMDTFDELRKLKKTIENGRWYFNWVINLRDLNLFEWS